MEDKDFKLLLYVVSGITVISFIYLIYKDLRNQKPLSQLSMQLSEQSVDTQSGNLLNNNQLMQLLENQQNQINLINNQITQVSNIIENQQNQQPQQNYLSSILASNDNINQEKLTKEKRNTVSLNKNISKSKESKIDILKLKPNYNSLSRVEKEKVIKKAFNMA